MSARWDDDTAVLDRAGRPLLALLVGYIAAAGATLAGVLA